MLPQRARTYGWLFVAMTASVCANILFFQQGSNANDPRAMRVAAGREAAPPAVQLSETVRALQRELKNLSLYPGQPDGKLSPLVTAAIVAYEQAQALPISGEPTQALLRELIMGPSVETSRSTTTGTGVVDGSSAEKLIRDVRTRLAALGYAVGNGDGRLTIELIQAIKAFERDNRLPTSGRISASLVLQLQRSTAAFKTRSG